MYTKFISKIIQEKLKAKERALARKPKSAQESTPDGFLKIGDLASRTTFVRMCSNKSKVPNILISGGENNEQGMPMGFGQTYRDRTNQEDNSGIRGIPGIKDITVEYKGGFKAIRVCTINWTIPAIEDLDKLTPYFLTVGKTVVVDWGWTNTKKQSLEEQGIEPFIIRKFNSDENKFEYIVNQEIFTNQQEKVLKSGGDYDAIGGTVSNFNYTLREDGGFDCTTIITAMGASLFQKPIDISGNSLGTRKAKKDGKVKYAPSDNMINCVLNLRNIIMYDYLGVKRKVFTGTTVTHKPNEHKQLLTEPLDPNNIDSQSRWFIYGQSENKFPEDGKGDAYGIAVDDKRNPNVVVAIRSGNREDIFVTWGWFEDQLLNRYLSFNGGEGEASGVKLTLRSIDTILDNEGKPIPTKDLEFGNLDFEEEDELVERYGVNLDVEQYNSTLKKPSVIRAPSLLYPVEPFNFFTVDVDLPKGKDTIQGLKKEGKSDLEKKDAQIETILDATAGAAVNIIPGGGLLRAVYKLFTSGDKLTSRDSEFYENFLNLLKRDGPSGTNFTSKIFRDSEKTQGKLRNIFVNIKEIQKAFGMKDPNNLKDTTQNNVSPPGTIETGVKNLLSSLNSNFHNIWNFDLVVDQFDSTNIKIIDKSDTEVDYPTYTKYKENSHEVQDLGLYKFPSFKMGSIVKTQNLEFKIPDSQALSILYGGNKKKGESDSQFNNAQSLDKLLRLDSIGTENDPYEDKFLGNLETSNIQSKETGDNEQEEEDKKVEKEFIVTTSPVGSEYSDHNSKITRENGIDITAGKSTHDKGPRKYPWRTYSPELKAAGEEKTKGKITEAYEVRADGSGNNDIFYVTSEATKDGATEKSAVKKTFYEFKDGDMIMKGGAQGALNSFLNASSPMAQFDMNSLIPTELNLEVDGTGGLLPGDIIHTEYIQHKYKANIKILALDDSTSTFDDPSFTEISSGPLCYFQLFGVVQKVTVDGWTTELQSKMRINKLPSALLSVDVPQDKPKDVEGPKITKTITPPPPRPYIPIPPDDEDIADDVELDVLEFDEFEEWEVPPIPQIPAPPTRPNIPVPMDDEDIADDVELDNLDFDEIPPWIPPSYPSTLSLRRAKQEITNLPERVPDQAPPDVPMIDVGEMMSEEDFLNVSDNLGTDASDNATDLVPYPPEPDPRLGPVLPTTPLKIKRGGEFDLNPLSLLDQIKTQKIIYVNPEPPGASDFAEETYPTTTGEVSKAQRFEAPQVEELNWESPTEVVMMVNENIKQDKPEEIKVETVPKETMEELKSTYRYTYNQNQILYAIREDWRPLYLQTNNKPGGGKRDSDDNLLTLLRAAQSKEVRKAFWDTYIEAPNKSGETKTSYTDKDNFQIYPEVAPTGNLLRRERDIYWYGEWNPNYEPPPS